MADDLRHWLGTIDQHRRSSEAEQAGAGSVEPELLQRAGLGKDVFVSYATPDKDAAFRLCRLLEEKGIGCWIAPRDVTPGADYGEAIIRAIETTAATVLLLSAHANASVHVTHEVERATSKRKRVIPVRLEDVLPGPSLELPSATAQWVDAWRLSPDQVAAQLARESSGRSRPAPAWLPAGDDPYRPPRRHPRNKPSRSCRKGLRSFDAHDADFFLELLPGPRDRDGLPDSIRFWKTRIEETDADNTFAVGLIYGPSGCGKSSLVKAGLLPRLSERRDRRLRRGHGRGDGNPAAQRPAETLPWPARQPGLCKETLALLRRGQGIPPGKKVLIVLDQFEQWLHAKKDEENTELVQALRQCDGGRVQCIVMVRDDFWMAVSRFLPELEIRLVEGQNCAAGRSLRPATMPGKCWRRLAEPSARCPKSQRHQQGAKAVPRAGRVRLGPGRQGHLACAWPCLPR